MELWKNQIKERRKEYIKTVKYYFKETMTKISNEVIFNKKDDISKYFRQVYKKSYELMIHDQEIFRKSILRDLMIMNRLVDDLRHEFKSVQDDLEEELVQHELTSLSLTPKFRKIESSISNTFDKQTDSLIDIQRNLNQISSSISDLNLETSSSGISEVNGVLPAISDKLRVLNENLKSQGSFVYEMQRELELVKRACGVD